MTISKVALGEAAVVLSGFAFKSELFSESDGIPLVRIRDVTRGYSKTFYTGPYSADFLVEDGDILVGMDGNFEAARWKGGPALLNQRVCRIKGRPAVLDDAYMFHFLAPALKKIEDATPFVTVKHLSAGDVRGIEIPLPPLPEQRRIAAILDQADALRAKRREALAHLDSLMQSIFVEMFGDPGSNPKSWPERQLGELILGAPNNGIFKKNDEYGTGTPVVWVEELFKGNEIDFSNSRALPASPRDKERYGLRNGDLLFCRSSLKLAGIGYNNVYLGEDGKALFECHVIRVSPDQERVEPRFLNFVLRVPSQRQKLFRFAKTVTMTTIDQDGLLKVSVPVPPVELQRKFCAHLTAVDLVRRRQMATVEELDALFASVQHRAFAGQL